MNQAGVHVISDHLATDLLLAPHWILDGICVRPELYILLSPFYEFVNCPQAHCMISGLSHSNCMLDLGCLNKLQ